MTELIVALDGPAPAHLMDGLGNEGGVKWFKIGPQTIASRDWSEIFHQPYWKIFLDLKLADTEDTVYKSVKHYANAGIAAVSTFTDEATEAALAAGTNIAIWQVHALTDDKEPYKRPMIYAPGVICGHEFVSDYIRMRKAHEALGKLPHPVDIVVPGVRFPSSEADGHLSVISPHYLKHIGATHAVVGRPIWQAKDPIAAAKEYMEALL